MTGLVLNHLWQSTFFAAGAWLLTLALRNNGAQTRFWVWFAASMKFLVPFAGLTALGGLFLTSRGPKFSTPALLLMQPVAQPFSTSMPPLPAPMAPRLDIVSLVLLLWGLGFCVIAVRWARRQLQLRRLLRDAVDISLHAPVPVKSVPFPLEPGLVGIWRPVVLLPDGITERLSAQELDAIMAHELCHLRRRDNLLAAIHMFVEALFWFHPLVWWLGKRMIAERERACDESVLASGKTPKIYADSILKVCKLYLHSPLTCAAGVAGADLKQRLEEIVENKPVHHLKSPKKALLAATAFLAVSVPVALGLVQAPPAQAQTSAPSAKAQYNVMVEASAIPGAPPRASVTNSATELQPLNQAQLRPPYPAISQGLGEQGTTSLMIMVDAAGDTIDAELTKSSGFPHLDQAAMDWVKAKWKWKPLSNPHHAPVMSTASVTWHLVDTH